MKSVLIQASCLKGQNVFKLLVPSNSEIEKVVFVEITEDDLQEIVDEMLLTSK